MRKCWSLILVTLLLLSGCATTQTSETVADEILQPAVSTQREVILTLPSGASKEVMESEDGGRLYFCDGYTMTVQILTGGDLNRSLESLCGYSADALTVLQTQDGAWKRQEWIWVSAGEGGEQLGRGALLDDGSYHYCLTVMADASEAGVLEAEWDAVFASFGIA